MKVRLLATRCFVFSAREKSYFVDGLVCFISRCQRVFLFRTGIPPERTKIVQLSLKREKSGSMQFVETKQGIRVSSQSPWNWSLLAAFSGWKISQNHSNDELMRCLVVFQHDCIASTFPPKVKQSSSLRPPALYSD